MHPYYARLAIVNPPTELTAKKFDRWLMDSFPSANSKGGNEGWRMQVHRDLHDRWQKSGLVE